MIKEGRKWKIPIVQDVKDNHDREIGKAERNWIVCQMEGEDGGFVAKLVVDLPSKESILRAIIGGITWLDMLSNIIEWEKQDNQDDWNNGS